ncbi:MAG: hypothetical protein IKW99_03365 [Bacteroidales bacterium]|nr:hypothetical protein [Bacteroidales bacterium]
MGREKFTYRSEIVSLIRAFDHLQDACTEMHDAIEGVWGEEIADKSMEDEMYPIMAKCDDLLELYMGRIAFLGLCLER